MPAPESPPLDALFDVLSASYRRRILQAIADHNPREGAELTLEEFAPDDADGDREVRDVQLRQVHLPKLADHGFVEWNPETETIRRGPNFEVVAPFVGALAAYEAESPDEELRLTRACEACGEQWNPVYLQDGVCTDCRGD